MAKILLGITAAVLLTAPVMAADIRMPAKAPPAAVVATAYNWTGFYIGGHVGYGWGRSKIFDVDGYGFGAETLRYNFNGIIGGVQAGYNWQMGSLLLGVEADFSLSEMKRHLPNPFGGFAGESFSTKVDWFGTGRLRFGYAANTFLLYGTGGFAFGHIDNRYNDPIDTNIAKASDVRWGWTLGGGLEIALAPNWTARAEYLYVDLEKSSASLSATVNCAAICRFDWENRFHVARAALNYRFGGPVVARY
jgi:outer membrane immunogenic protein